MNPALKGDPTHKVKVLCTNPDVTYSDSHLLPRFTIGAVLLQVVNFYKMLTNKEVEIEF